MIAFLLWNSDISKVRSNEENDSRVPGVCVFTRKRKKRIGGKAISGSSSSLALHSQRVLLNFLWSAAHFQSYPLREGADGGLCALADEVAWLGTSFFPEQNGKPCVFLLFLAFRTYSDQTSVVVEGFFPDNFFFLLHWRRLREWREKQLFDIEEQKATNLRIKQCCEVVGSECFAVTLPVVPAVRDRHFRHHSQSPRTLTATWGSVCVCV